MRDLMADNTTIDVRDEIGGCVHQLYFRQPTSTERVQFQAGRLVRRDNQIVDRSFVQQVHFGAKILTGFRKGTFGADGKPIASDTDDPDYREDWRELLTKQAPEIVAVVGRIAFGGVDVVQLPENLENMEFVTEELDSDDPLDG